MSIENLFGTISKVITDTAKNISEEIKKQHDDMVKDMNSQFAKASSNEEQPKQQVNVSALFEEYMILNAERFSISHNDIRELIKKSSTQYGYSDIFLSQEYAKFASIANFISSK